MGNKKYIFFLLLLPILGFTGCRTHEIIEGKSLTTSRAIVVSAHPEASRIGAGVIAGGGNAIDAAVAVQFALAVCYPSAGNIGGGGFLVLRLNDGTVDAIDFREKAPYMASRDMFLDADGEVVKNLSTDTRLASGVPGSVDGMAEAHAKYGKLPWKRLVQPAVDLAENGFIIAEKQAASFNSMRRTFNNRNRGKEVRLAGESPWKPGDILIQPELAQTLRLIRDNGREGFYSGPVADLIVEEMKRGNGIITHDDLKSYRSEWRPPLRGKYREVYDIISMAPPSGGGVALIQLLGITGTYDLAGMGFHTTESIHLMAEAERRVYADRAEFLGDPDFYPVPVTELLDRDYLNRRMTGFDAARATPSSEIRHGDISFSESEETTHFSIVDTKGNAVAVTTTLNASYGNGIFVSGAGFLLNNEMDDFSVKAGVPNMFGLVGGEANEINPGKRMLSSMTPTIVEKDGRLFMIVGSPGGSTIITSVYQTIVNVIDFNMTINEAVAAGRFHHQWLPDQISYESGVLDPLLTTRLREMGHLLSSRGSIGRVDAILITDGKKLSGAADPRGDDFSAGF